MLKTFISDQYEEKAWKLTDMTRIHLYYQLKKQQDSKLSLTLYIPHISLPITFLGASCSIIILRGKFYIFDSAINPLTSPLTLRNLKPSVDGIWHTDTVETWGSHERGTSMKKLAKRLVPALSTPPSQRSGRTGDVAYHPLSGPQSHGYHRTHRL